MTRALGITQETNGQRRITPEPVEVDRSPLSKAARNTNTRNPSMRIVKLRTENRTFTFAETRAHHQDEIVRFRNEFYATRGN